MALLISHAPACQYSIRQKYIDALANSRAHVFIFTHTYVYASELTYTDTLAKCALTHSSSFSSSLYKQLHIHIYTHKQLYIPTYIHTRRINIHIQTRVRIKHRHLFGECVCLRCLCKFLYLYCPHLTTIVCMYVYIRDPRL